jgi:metallophosphoesterase superfamily enzyme
MPAIGALTGGLNVLDKAFKPLFPNGLTAHALGRERIYTLSSKRLVVDA